MMRQTLCLAAALLLTVTRNDVVKAFSRCHDGTASTTGTVRYGAIRGISSPSASSFGTVSSASRIGPTGKRRTGSVVERLRLCMWNEVIQDSSWIATTAATTAMSSSTLLSTASAVISPEPIHSAFTVATFLPQPFWILMILFPNAELTKRIMGGLQVPLLLCAVHFFIVVASLSAEGGTAPLAEFNDVFDVSGDPQRAFMGMTSNYPNFVAEEWSHVLTWDLFVGRYIWLDSLDRKVPAPAASASVLLCNLIGPPGLLLYWLTTQVWPEKVE